jgi:L-ascorbate metabolism protein UlaG (beta-lactamase superfamily)
MKVKFLGHSCFLITSSLGMKILTDPYHTGEEFSLSEIEESADVVTVSHEHPDHNNAGVVQGNPMVLKSSASVSGIDFKAVESYHDNAGGKERGNNRIFLFEVEGVKLCHLGDLGHQLNHTQLSDIGKVDILMVPVGGGFTIDFAGATQVCNLINPKVTIPMHYKTAGLKFLEDVQEFLRGKEVITPGKSELEFTPDSLPAKPQVIVLTPELLTD